MLDDGSLRAAQHNPQSIAANLGSYRWQLKVASLQPTRLKMMLNPVLANEVKQWK